MKRESTPYFIYNFTPKQSCKAPRVCWLWETERMQMQMRKQMFRVSHLCQGRDSSFRCLNLIITRLILQTKDKWCSGLCMVRVTMLLPHKKTGKLLQSLASSQSPFALGVSWVQILRGATGWKLNRDGISQSEPVSTGLGLTHEMGERRAGFSLSNSSAFKDYFYIVNAIN